MPTLALGYSACRSTRWAVLGMAIAIVIVLAATTFGSALVYAISGFGFAVLAAPLFLLFLDPPRTDNARRSKIAGFFDCHLIGATQCENYLGLLWQPGSL